MTRRGRKRLLILSIGVLTVASALVAAHQYRGYRRSRLAAEAYESGMAAYESGAYESAMADLGYAVARGYDDCDTMLALAESRVRVPLENSRHLLQGVTLFRQAAAIDSNRIEPIRRLVDLYGQLNFLTERLDAADTLLELDPDSIAGHRARIESLLGLGRYAPAVDAADTYLASNPTSIKALELRVVAMGLAGATTSERCDFVERLANENPSSVEIAVIQAETLVRAGRREEARAAIERSLDLGAPGPATAPRLIAAMDLVGLSGRVDALLAALAVESTLDTPAVSLLIVERAWKRRQFNTALEALNARSESISERSDDLLGWGAFVRQTSDRDPSIERQELATRQTDSARYWIAMLDGHEQWTTQDLRQASVSFSEAISLRPDDAVAPYFLGRVDAGLGEFVRAAHHLESAANADPSWLDAQIHLAATHLADARYDDALTAARRAFALQPTASHAMLLAEVYADCAAAGAGGAQLALEAMEVIETLRRLAPTNGDLHATHARILAIAGEIEEALIETTAVAANADGIAPARLIGLANAIRAGDSELADRLGALARTAGGVNPSLVRAEAFRAARNGSIDAGRTIYDEAIGRTTDARIKEQLEFDREVFLDHFDDPQALSRLLALAAARPSSVHSPRAILSSRSAWKDESIISDAIVQLRAVTGDSATSWMIFEARRLLAFDPGERRASQVVELLTPLLRVDASNPDALGLLAEAYLQFGDRDAAIDRLTIAVEAHPYRPDLMPRLIDLLRIDGRRDEAERRLRDYASRPAPLQDRTTTRERLDLLIEYQMWDAAERDAARLADSSLPDDRRRLALVHTARGRFDEARAIYAGLLAGSDADAPTARAAAELEASDGLIDEGVAILDRFAAESSSVDAARLAPEFLERHGRLDEARRRFDELARSSHPEIIAAIAQFLLRQGETDTAHALLAQSLEKSPADEGLVSLYQLAELLRSDDAYANEALLDLADTLVAESQREAFTELIETERWRRDHPDDHTAYLDRLRRTTLEHPTAIGGWLLLVDALRTHAPIEDAVTAAQAAARANPTSTEIAKLLTSTLLSATRFDEARTAARRWRSIDPAAAFEADVAISLAEAQSGSPTAARSLLDPYRERILAEAEEDPDLFLFYLQVLLSLDDFEAVDTMLAERVVDADWAPRAPTLAGAIRDAERAQVWLATLDERIQSRDDARPALVMAWYTLGGRLNDDAGCFARAIELSESIAEPTDQTLAVVADCERLLGRTDRAIDRYRALVQAEPDDAVARNNLAYLLLTTDRDLDEAEAHARAALAIADRSRFPAAHRASFLDTLGAICQARGRYAEATDAFEQATTLQPRNPSLELKLIESLLADDRLDRAASRLRRFRSSFGPADLSPSQQERLTELSAQIPAS
ncbi:MAG: tetratricopeptide repeat protein [Phycisphaerales bacterium]